MKTKRKRKQSGNNKLNDGIPNEKVTFDVDLLGENMDLNTAPLSPAVSKIQVATQTECKSQEEEKSAYFINQATCAKNWYRYTGFTRAKRDLVFEFLEPKATEIHYWRGSKNTKSSSKNRKPKKTV